MKLGDVSIDLRNLRIQVLDVERWSHSGKSYGTTKKGVTRELEDTKGATWAKKIYGTDLKYLLNKVKSATLPLAQQFCIPMSSTSQGPCGRLILGTRRRLLAWPAGPPQLLFCYDFSISFWIYPESRFSAPQGAWSRQHGFKIETKKLPRRHRIRFRKQFREILKNCTPPIQKHYFWGSLVYVGHHFGRKINNFRCYLNIWFPKRFGIAFL